MRILHIVPYFAPAFAYGGTVRAVYDLVMRLAERGHKQAVLTTDAHDSFTRLPRGSRTVEGILTVRVPNISNRLAWRRIFLPVGFGRAVARTLRSCDVVHLHEVRSMLNAAALPHLLSRNIPYIVSPHGGLRQDLQRVRAKKLYDTLVGHRLLHHAAGLHALNAMEREQYRTIGCEDDRVFVNPNGLDTTAFDIDTDVEAFKRRYGIPLGQPVVGFLGRLHPIKGVDFLVEAFADVHKRLPGTILMLVGPNDGARFDLETQIARLGLGEVVRFVGYIDAMEDKAAAYRASDVYVLPSRSDMQPTTPLEALLNRVPIIVTERCGLAGYFQQMNTGRVVQFGDVQQLADAIISTVTAPPRPIGYERVRHDFDWSTLVTRWEQHYQRFIKEA